MNQLAEKNPFVNSWRNPRTDVDEIPAKSGETANEKIPTTAGSSS